MESRRTDVGCNKHGKPGMDNDRDEQTGKKVNTKLKTL